MPYLGDYLGHLLSEITNARVQADLETVRIAELYSSHPLLKHMPVPHFRLPTVTLDVPLVINDIETDKKGTALRERIQPIHMRKSFDNILVPQLERAGIKLSSRETMDLKRELDQKVKILKKSQKVPISVTHIADEMVYTVVKKLRESARDKEVDFARIDKLAEDLRTASHVEFTKFLYEPDRINVRVTNKELREAGPRELLMQVRLSITEEAMEWAVIESDGKIKSRLVQE
ncbi:MAG: hypothetical protein ACT6FD_02110 [Methanosarcinaceae archaeon]